MTLGECYVAGLGIPHSTFTSIGKVTEVCITVEIHRQLGTEKSGKITISMELASALRISDWFKSCGVDGRFLPTNLQQAKSFFLYICPVRNNAVFWVPACNCHCAYIFLNAIGSRVEHQTEFTINFELCASSVDYRNPPQNINNENKLILQGDSGQYVKHPWESDLPDFLQNL